MNKNPEFEKIFAHTVGNDLEILHSEKCSCIFCRHTINARDVQDWISDDRGVTAICPECGMDALVGDASGYHFDHETLKDLNLAFFGEDYMERHPEAARTYCERYRDGKISHKKANEALYIQYLALLSRLNDPYATFDLATLLEFGSEFTEPDPKTAFSYYMSSCLEGDGQALTRMGVLCESGVLGSPDYRGAYECYAKAMAFGSANGLLHFADCYLKGVFVEKNPNLAYQIISNFYPDCYSRYVASTGKDPLVFAGLCYRMGVMHQMGLGVQQSSFNAMRFFLMADSAFMIQGEAYMDGEDKAIFEDCFKRINELAKVLNYTQKDPTFDVDTFAESLEVNSWGNRGGFEGCTISEIIYDNKRRELSFVMTCPSPILIVDCASMFAGFVGEPIRWIMNDVARASAKFAENNGPVAFNRVYGNGDEGFRFCLYKDGEEEEVAEITLTAVDEETHVEVKQPDQDKKGQA